MPPLEVYEGDRPYIFVSYAHADEGAVMPLINALVAEGYRVWWDEGIQETEDFPDYIAKHVLGCACFVTIVSSLALDSVWCVNEAKYAFNHRKRILPIYLEEVELPGGLELCIGMTQSMYWCRYATDEAFYRRLFAMRALSSCLTEEGRRRRGVKRRPGGNGATGPRATEPQPADLGAKKAGGSNPVSGAPQLRQRVDSQSGVTRSIATDGVAVGSGDARAPGSRLGDGSAVVQGAEPRDGLADYPWAELKVLSRAIADADENEWLAIAKTYNLVGEDGRLRGDEKCRKPVTLGDGTRTSVRILGFRHDELAGGGRAGISFEFADVPMKHRMNPEPTNAGGWEASGMRGWLNDGRRGFLSLLPDDLRPLVETAAKRTNNRGGVGENNTACVTATPDRLWLLSMSEVYGRLSAQKKNVPWSPATYDAEGEQYQLYADGGVSTSSYGFCRKRGASSWWWLRSPYAYDTYWFHRVYGGGGWFAYSADNDWGVSPGFCF